MGLSTRTTTERLPEATVRAAPAERAKALLGHLRAVLEERRARPRWASARSYLPSSWATTLAVGALAALFNWAGWQRIKPGLDSSWQAGLADGFNHHLQWGPAFDFTYGPYGFADYLQPLYRSTSLIAVAYIFAVTSLVGALVVAGTRRYWGLAGAGLVAWAVVGLAWVVGRSSDFAAVAGLALALSLLQCHTKNLRTSMVALMGVLAGFSVLVKLNDGIVLVALVVLGALGFEGPWRERWRLLAVGTGSAVAMFALAWAGAGQSFSNLFSFARVSASLVLGYSANMGGRLASRSIPWWAIAIVLTAASVVAIGLRHRPRGAQIASVVMLAGWCWSVTKDGFVSGNHFPSFFRLLLAATALLCFLRVPKAVYATGLLVAAWVTMAVTTVPGLDPVGGVHNFASQLATVANGGRFAKIQAADRQSIISREPVPASVLAMVRGRTLAIEPWEDMVAWAVPQARWDPEPVVQSYSAYTAYTDQLDAAFLGSPAAPQRILYWHFHFSFDFRDPFMDPPATTQAVYCHYVQLAVEGRWQVLGRVPDRCGRAQEIGLVHTHFGQVVEVPADPGKLVVATFSFAPTLLDKLASVVLKPPRTYLTTWSAVRPSDAGTGPAREGPVTYTFVTGTAGDNHVLAAPATLGYSRPFRPTPVRRLELTGDGWGTGQGSVTVKFYALGLHSAS